jgi:hypothetical protein
VLHSITHLRNPPDGSELRMLFLYVSLHDPSMIVCLNLPISTTQRLSLWSRRTRHELRNLARSLIVSHLGREQGVGQRTNDHHRITTIRYEDLGEGIQPTERRAISGEYRAQQSRTMLMSDDSRT